MLSQIGVAELTNHNDGPKVGMYLQSVGLKQGYEWCSAFCSWNYTHCGLKGANTPWAPAWFNTRHIVYSYRPGSKINSIPQTGDLIGYYYTNQGRIGHIGMVLQWGDKYVTTVEGNVGDPGGVYKLIRPVWQCYQVANWVDII